MALPLITINIAAKVDDGADSSSSLEQTQHSPHFAFPANWSDSQEGEWDR